MVTQGGAGLASIAAVGPQHPDLDPRQTGGKDQAVEGVDLNGTDGDRLEGLDESVSVGGEIQAGRRTEPVEADADIVDVDGGTAVTSGDQRRDSFHHGQAKAFEDRQQR